MNLHFFLSFIYHEFFILIISSEINFMPIMTFYDFIITLSFEQSMTI